MPSHSSTCWPPIFVKSLNVVVIHDYFTEKSIFKPVYYPLCRFECELGLKSEQLLALKVDTLESETCKYKCTFHSTQRSLFNLERGVRFADFVELNVSVQVKHPFPAMKGV